MILAINKFETTDNRFKGTVGICQEFFVGHETACGKIRDEFTGLAWESPVMWCYPPVKHDKVMTMLRDNLLDSARVWVERYEREHFEEVID